MLVELRPGTSPEEAARVLNQVGIESNNMYSGPNTRHMRDLYLDWVERTEGQLRNVFANPQVCEELYTDNHWRIRRMEESEPRPVPLIELELRRQRERLDSLHRQIQETQRWVEASAGRCVVIDTNVLLHYMPPEQIAWNQIAGSSDGVRLVVPLRVVTEIDGKKYVRDDKIGKRARSVLTHLGGALLTSSGGPTELAPGVSIEVAPFREPLERPLDADWEILSCCLALLPYASDLVLATGDTAMRIRAQQLGIDCREIPEAYLRSKTF